MSDVTLHETQYLPTDRLIPAPWNPNEMTPQLLEKLITEISEVGFLEDLIVVEMDVALRRTYLTPEQDADAGPWWLIIGGHHRHKAGVAIGMEVMPCKVRHNMSDDDVKMHNVRLNMLRGKIDPVRMVQLYEEVAERHGEELVKEGMGLYNEREFKAMVRSVRTTLPPEVRQEFDKQTRGIQDPDDLYRIVSELLARSGDTLALGYCVFTYAGQSCLWLEMGPQVKAMLEEITQDAYTRRVSINDIFEVLLADAVKRTQHVKSTEEPLFGS